MVLKAVVSARQANACAAWAQHCPKYPGMILLSTVSPKGSCVAPCTQPCATPVSVEVKVAATASGSSDAEHSSAFAF